MIRAFYWGLIISFLGTLPLGTLNVAAMQIAIYEGVMNALFFSIGALIVEMIYVRISLVGIEWVRKRQKLMLLLEWLALIIIFTLAGISLYGAWHYVPGQTNTSVNPFAAIGIHRVFLGMSMSAVNPMQIPFWFAWSAYLFNKGVLVEGSSNYNMYIIGIGGGTFLGNAVFIFGGRYVAGSLTNNQHIIHWAIGILFLIAGIVQAIKMIRQGNKPMPDA